MGAIVFRLQENELYDRAIRTASEALRNGKLVVFPTETVYGIGCNALDKNAVCNLYKAKQRPPEKPLLLHLHSVEQAETLSVLDERARLLLDVFTPGPLSVITKKKASVPYEVTSGGETVGLRFPSNELFLELSKEAGVPIAATSANLSGFVSAKDGKAAEALCDIADVILDGGVCRYSIESTVLSLAGDRPRILRLGAIPREKLEEVIGVCD